MPFFFQTRQTTDSYANDKTGSGRGTMRTILTILGSILGILMFLLLLFLLVAGIVLFIYFMTEAQYYGFAAAIWAITLAFLLLGLVLALLPCCVCHPYRDETDHPFLAFVCGRWFCGTLTTLFFLLGLLTLLALSCVCFAVCFELRENGSSYGNVQVVYLGSFYNDTNGATHQKLFVRVPRTGTVVNAQFSPDGGSTWFDGNPPAATALAAQDNVLVFTFPMAAGAPYRVRVRRSGIADDDDDDDDDKKRDLSSALSNLQNNNISTEIANFVFRTPPPQNYTGEVTFSHGSCLFRFWRHGLPMWNDIANKIKPEFFLFIGDFIYADVVRPHHPTHKEWFRSNYRRMFSVDDIRNNFIKWPNYFMFDDHEVRNNFNIADNNFDQNEYTNAISQAWNIYLGQGNPGKSLNDNVYYYTFTIASGSFFVLDTRSYRTLPRLSGSSMLGVTQRNALLSWLSETNSTFKFIVSTVSWTRNVIDGDSWNDGFFNERQIIMSHIANNHISGVSILTGDSHWLGVLEVDPGIFEFSISPIDGFGTVSDGFAQEVDPVLCHKTGHKTRNAGSITYTLTGNAGNNSATTVPTILFTGYSAGRKAHFDSASCGPMLFRLQSNGRFSQPVFV